MKKLLMIAAFLGLGWFSTALAQETKKDSKQEMKSERKEQKDKMKAENQATRKNEKAVAVSKGNTKTKADGTPDKRYKENKKLKKDGTPDKRYKENKGK
ncbi:MAG: hypothetical protein IPP32_06985 [Bacteroidetes bacterium]|nr:hypothetical protein [Bacteroidota bacterium]